MSVKLSLFACVPTLFLSLCPVARDALIDLDDLSFNTAGSQPNCKTLKKHCVSGFFFNTFS